MFGRTLVAVLAVIVVVAAIAGAGTYIYNAGLSAGVAEAARVAAASGEAAPVVIYPGYGWGHGPGFGWGFGIIFWILGFFLLFGLLRAAFGWGRWGGHGDGRRGRWEQIHREMHERERTDATG